MTYRIAYSAGLDAANRQMRSAGRAAWNEDDANLAAASLSRHLPLCAEHPGICPEARQGFVQRAVYRQTHALALAHASRGGKRRLYVKALSRDRRSRNCQVRCSTRSSTESGAVDLLAEVVSRHLDDEAQLL